MKRMLFNATNSEELRVAIVDGQKLIDIDIETSGREQRKGNIYKGVITRIEPSLEACFVNYGEERHGFLPFKEIDRSYFKPGVDVRSARIQDALSEGQELIVQVEKEERGNKGAALTTMVSLAGRYLVLMPNNPRGGGVSRRIEGEDRNELRDAMSQLDIPQGMSIIARTAGIGRSAEELRWDLEHSLRLWSAIDGAASPSLDEKGKRENPAPFLIYLESSLVIRAIRDYYQPDIGEILIDTPEIFEQTQAFMGAVMPQNVHRVKLYTDDIPLYSRFQIEHQIETAYSRTVPLPSGGAIVIDHTEALVSVDVNSARATRGSDIEDTAFRTNVEAAEEVARQLRLRDLGGLIVIDFIDMESAKNQKEVESRLKDALHHDRARVQMGKISRFGLMELSRQRLRPSLSEASHTACPRCNGIGVIRDIESSALHVLRIIQEEAMKEHTAVLNIQIPVDVATFLLNEKRAEIHTLESRTKTNIVLIPNKYLETPHYKLERMRHDDDRLEDPKPSYEQAEKPSEDAEYKVKSAQEAAPRQEAAVKGIIPSTPAPTPVERTVTEAVAQPAPPVKQGFWGTLKSWFFGKPLPVEPVVQAPVEPEIKAAPRNNNGRNAHNNRSRSEERSGQRNNQRRNPRSERGEKPETTTTDRPERTERKEVKDTDSTTPAAPRERRPRQERPERPERVELTPEQKAERAERNNERRQRAPRAERTERAPRNEAAAETTATAPAEVNVTPIVVEIPAAPSAATATVFAVEAENKATATTPTEAATETTEPTGERRERRSRGGRDRRERRERRESRDGTPELSTTANTISQLMREDEPALDHTPITIEIPAHAPTKGATFIVAPIEASHAVTAPIAHESDMTNEPVQVFIQAAEAPAAKHATISFTSEPAAQVFEAEPVVAVVSAAAATAAVVTATTEVTTEVIAPAVAHAEPLIESVSEAPAEIEVEVKATAPVDVPALIEITPTAQPLDEVLNQAGLELIHTTASTVPFVMTPPVRTHAPRERKPRSTEAEAPLQMVETSNPPL